METDHLASMETVFKADRCEGEGGGTILVRQKWSPQQVRREETCRQTTLETQVIPQQVWREETDELSWKQFSEGAGGGTIIIVNNQRWVGDRLAMFVRAILKECSCSMMLIAG